MLVLDENLPAGQRLLLRKWRLRFRVVGVDVAARGTDDENLVPVLHSLSQPTFFSLDRDFYRPDWAHPNYGLIRLDVADDQAAEFILRFLRHSTFDTQAKRKGIVARVHSEGGAFWRAGEHSLHLAPWRTK